MICEFYPHESSLIDKAEAEAGAVSIANKVSYLDLEPRTVVLAQLTAVHCLSTTGWLPVLSFFMIIF